MSEESFRLTLSSEGSIVAASGEIDAHSAPLLSDALDPLPGSGDVELDLGEVSFVDSSGLRVIIDTHQRAEAADRRLVITNPSKAVTRLIEISGLADHLNVSTAS